MASFRGQASIPMMLGDAPRYTKEVLRKKRTIFFNFGRTIQRLLLKYSLYQYVACLCSDEQACYSLPPVHCSLAQQETTFTFRMAKLYIISNTNYMYTQGAAYF